MDKTLPENIKDIRTAVMASEVREGIAQGMEYVEQFANTATTKAKEAAASAKTAADAAGNASTAISAAIDPTLSVSGKAADAKETGDAIQGVKDDLASESKRAADEEQRLNTAVSTEKTRAEKAEQALLAILRLLAAGNAAAMAACDRLAALWGTTQPEKPDQPTDTAFAVLGQAILGKMILGRSK